MSRRPHAMARARVIPSPNFRHTQTARSFIRHHNLPFRFDVLGGGLRFDILYICVHDPQFRAERSKILADERPFFFAPHISVLKTKSIFPRPCSATRVIPQNLVSQFVVLLRDLQLHMRDYMTLVRSFLFGVPIHDGSSTTTAHTFGIFRIQNDRLYYSNIAASIVDSDRYGACTLELTE